MKSVRFMLAVLMLASTVALAQSDAQKFNAQKSEARRSEASKPEAHSAMQKPAAQPEEERAFEKLKTLAGSWQGKVTTDPPDIFPQDPDPAKNVLNVTLRVTSMGNAIMHNMTSPARPDDPITMLYRDGGQLLLTHYCDAGNRPRMAGKLSPDGKRVEFDFLDMTGPAKYGHMRQAAFTFIDENHHIEEWTFILPGDKAVRARFDLTRLKSAEVAAR